MHTTHIWEIFQSPIKNKSEIILENCLCHLILHLDGNILGIFIHVGHRTTVLLLVQQQLKSSYNKIMLMKSKKTLSIPIVNRVAMKSPMKTTGFTSSCFGSAPASAAAGASSSSCSSPVEVPGSSSAILTSTCCSGKYKLH